MWKEEFFFLCFDSKIFGQFLMFNYNIDIFCITMRSCYNILIYISSTDFRVSIILITWWRSFVLLAWISLWFRWIQKDWVGEASTEVFVYVVYLRVSSTFLWIFLFFSTLYPNYRGVRMLNFFRWVRTWWDFHYERLVKRASNWYWRYFLTFHAIVRHVKFISTFYPFSTFMIKTLFSRGNNWFSLKMY
jgi:hypothetical protein